LLEFLKQSSAAETIFKDAVLSDIMNSDGGDLERWVMVSVTRVRALLEAYSADGTTRPRHSMGRGDHAPRRRLLRHRQRPEDLNSAQVSAIVASS
jgi:hypothetical protein